MEAARDMNSTRPEGLQQWIMIAGGILVLSLFAFLNLLSFHPIPLVLILAVPLLISACVIFVKRPIYAFLALILLLPLHALAMSLLVTYSGAPELAIKVFAAWKEAVVLVVFSAVVIRQLRSTDKIELTLADWLAILYLFIICMLGLTPGLQEDREPLPIRLYGIRDAGFLIVVYFTGRFTPLVSKDLGKVLRALYAVGVFSALIGFFEYFFLPVQVLLVVGYVNYTRWLGTTFTGALGLPENLYVELGGALVRRMFSIFLMSNIYAQCLVLIVPAIAYIRATSSRRKALIATFALGATLVALFLTITRASIVACILALFIVGYLLRDKLTRRIAGFISGAIVIGALGIVLYRPSVGVVTTSDTSIESHFNVWAESIQTIIDSPIIGLGAGTSGFASTRDKVNGRENTWGGENQYFVIGVEFGLIALLLHLGFIYAILRGSLRAFHAQTDWGPRGVCLVAFAGGVGVAINAATTAEWAVTFPTFVFWWIAGMSIQMAAKGEAIQTMKIPVQPAVAPEAL